MPVIEFGQRTKALYFERRLTWPAKQRLSQEKGWGPYIPGSFSTAAKLVKDGTLVFKAKEGTIDVRA